MRILGIDTTRKIARLFVYDENSENKTSFIAVDENIKHSEGVFLYLEKLLYETNLNLNDFDYFSAVVGPGSFTGIRVGMSIIKGFNKALNNKIIPINTFEILANSIKNGVVILNSTTTSCYFSNIRNRQIISAGVVDKNNIADLANGENIYILSEEQNLINIEYNNVIVIENICDCYISTILNKISNDMEDIFEPYYLQLSQAERNLKHE